jgi:hypothetical protein
MYTDQFRELRKGDQYPESPDLRLELKAAGGRLSPPQREAHAAMRAAGATVAVAVGLDNALRQLERWKLLRGEMQ